MPVYVYRNLVSGETFEVQQRMTEDALTIDPRTGDPVRRVIQPVGIAFKGSGFYVNDSRGSSSTGSGTDKPAAAPAAATDKPAAASAAATDSTKPAATDNAASKPSSPSAPAAAAD